MDRLIAMDAAPPEPTTSCFRRRIGLLCSILMLLGVASYAGRLLYLQQKANWGVVVPGKIYRSATIPRSLVRQKLIDNKIATIVFLSRDTGDDPDLSAEWA